MHNNDLGREYELEEGDQGVWHTAEVFNLFTKWLQANVLTRIQEEPVPNERIDAFPDDVTIPLPDELGALFTFGEYGDNERITKGQEDPSQIEASDRYGLQASGYRLASPGIRGDFPEVAYDGFLWCGIGKVTSETTIESLEVPGYSRRSDRERFVIRVELNRANGVYIADYAAYEKRREELREQLGGRVGFTDAEVDEMYAARAATIVPVVDYNGEFEQPVVLINRELSFDEVEMVSGPHKDWQGR